jgi:predicted ATPase
MAISWLSVEGFKSLRNVAWKPERLNVLIGPNGSGKSNLLDLLELLSTAASGDLSATVQESGGIDALLWDGRESEIRIQLTHMGSPQPMVNFLGGIYTLTLQKIAHWNSFVITNEFLSGFKPDGFSTFLLERRVGEAALYDLKQEALVQVASQVPGEESLLSAAAGPLSNFDLTAFKVNLESWTIYRGLDTRPDSPIRQPALTRREAQVNSSGENLVSVLHTLYTEDRQFRKELHAAMHAVFGDEFEELTFPPASDQKVQLRVGWRSLKRPQSSAVLSDGTLRFLFLITVLANPSPPPLIAIEEPEVGLHPSMLPVIAEYAAEASKRCQVIFTTHSPDFLDAFRNASVQPTTTVTKWENGETHLNVLRGEDLEYWLREYTLGQLFRSNELEQIG